MTNFERIKTLSIEEMTKFIDSVENDGGNISYDFCTNKMCGRNCNEDDDCSFDCDFDVLVKLWLEHEETDFWK